MAYLDASEYEQFGIDPAVPESWVELASSLIEAHCRRPTLNVGSYTERLRVAPGDTVVRVSHLPLVKIDSARGRFGSVKRYDVLTDVAAAFQIPGSWMTVDPEALDCFAETGEVTVPVTVLGFGFDELELTYSAGWEAIPRAVKHACAQIVRNASATPALNVKSSKVDALRVEYFRDSLLDGDVRALLAPYVARKVG